MSKFTLKAVERDGWIVISMANRAGRTWIYNQKCWEMPHEAFKTITGIEARLDAGEKLDPAFWTDAAPIVEGDRAWDLNYLHEYTEV